MKIGFLAKQNAFLVETFSRFKLGHSQDEFSAWEPGRSAPSTDMEVVIAIGKVDAREIEAQTKLGLIQMASAG